MNEPIEETYFNWLCAKIKENSGSNHMALFRILYEFEYIWNTSVPGDRNRVEDGKELKSIFCNYDFAEQNFLNQPCSVLEMLISFSDRASFQTGKLVEAWFWELMTNLKLNDFRRVTGNDADKIHNILYTFIWRQYETNGEGGLFPLRRTQHDQRKVEIWYQFFEYLEDQGFY